MDTFDELLAAAAQESQDSGIPFDDALTSVLSDTEDGGGMPDADGASAAPQAQADEPLHRIPVVTPELLAQAIAMVTPVEVCAVLSADVWEDSGSEAYPFVCQYRSPVFASHKRTDMYIAAESSGAALAAELCPVIDTNDGSVTILSKRIPESDLDVTFLVSISMKMNDTAIP